MEQRQFNGETVVFSKNGTRRIEHPYAKKKKNLHTDLTPFTKIKSKYIIGLNGNCNTINI